ncbi:hypothetical protein OPQ81_000884 [Rhizoctonia solani]|nr:hypothetical protein OPQ81_000884 [Rhizoctonia solani]
MLPWQKTTPSCVIKGLSFGGGLVMSRAHIIVGGGVPDPLSTSFSRWLEPLLSLLWSPSMFSTWVSGGSGINYISASWARFFIPYKITLALSAPAK